MKIYTGDPGALNAAKSAVLQFPKNSYLHYILYEILLGKQDPKALEQLDLAIELQTRPGLKAAWIDVLLPAAVTEDRRDLVEKHLLCLAAEAAEPSRRLEVAQRMVRYKFFSKALELLEKNDAQPPAPETMVSIELEAAAAEIGLKKTKEAAVRLDRLLSKLTADYWRRGEIVARRLQLVDSQADRDAMIDAARKRVEKSPRDEAVVLDLVQLMTTLQLRRDALKVLLEAGRLQTEATRVDAE